MTKIGYKPLIALALALCVGISIASAAKEGVPGTNTVYINEIPYTITDSGKYLLNISKSDISGTAIIINADNVILDGNGNYLEGDSTGSTSFVVDMGVYVYPKSRVTIRDMNISKFGSGIYLANSSECTIFKNDLSKNDVGIRMCRTNNSNIEDNEIYECTGPNAIGLYSSYYANGNNIVNNLVNNNDIGLKFAGVAMDNRIISNEIIDNENYGMVLGSSCNNNTVNANIALGNTPDIYMDFETNLVNGNKYDTIE
ncbi:right-handed parallel beta-helix repeat-containing protein [Methanococcus maripaludis]|uniref:Parallel beta-helix repeat protein n=2 Tax=Methanococcus maripaludis TaxID=39152 RepID=A0A7J9PG85_METMI|nr:right-handed parallel beta-helix repeat-containing protein [Methanococcus maripaludis]MBA2862242.1 parallel beta-helix repeat protein [Methanococcus maripaludis]